MRYIKPPTTIDHQIALMASRGLVIKDEARLRRELSTIGYYRLSGYWLHFEETPTNGDTRSKRFKSGTRHEDVIDLYIFDRKLRLRIMEAIERLEVAVRASWTYRLSLAAGSHAHLDPKNFRDRGKHSERLVRPREAVVKSKVQSPDTCYAKRLAALVMDKAAARQRMAMGFPGNWRERPIWGLAGMVP